MPSHAQPDMSGERFGVYIDSVYRVVPTADGREISTDRSFLLFVLEVGKAFDRLVLFGRALPSDASAEYVMPADVQLVELPHYEALRDVFRVLPTVGGTARTFWRGLRFVDTLWIFGPHPFAVLLVAMAALRRKRVVLGVRQHSVRLYEARVTGWRRVPSLAAVRALDLAYRLFARRLRVTVQGLELADWYGGDPDRVLPTAESVVRRSEIASRLPDRDWTGQIELLTVGRFETEKNPMLLVRALARLEAERPGRYRLTWVGRGPLEEDVLAEARRLGVDRLIELHGYVPFDAGLLDLYRRAHVFVHVSLSEGMPKVLIEALVCATPTVATDVGGVRAALDDGRAGLLVPPDDLDALVGGIQRLDDDADLRERVAGRGLELAVGLTLEAQAARVVRFIRGKSQHE